MENFIVRASFKYVLLFIQVYAFYVILHGHLSPGGGFAGGIVLGLSMVLFLFVFGMSQASRKLPLQLAIVLIGAGGTLEGIKFLLPVGGNDKVPGELFLGLLSVMSLAIGMLVASSLLTMFYLFMEDKNERF